MKKGKTVTKGDIFVVRLNSYQKYFQFLIEDRCQLNGKVITVFRRKDYLGYKPSLEEIAMHIRLFRLAMIVGIGKSLVTHLYLMI